MTVSQLFTVITLHIEKYKSVLNIDVALKEFQNSAGNGHQQQTDLASPLAKFLAYAKNLSRYSTWLVTSRFDMTRHVRRVERVVPVVMSVSSRAARSATQPKCRAG